MLKYIGEAEFIQCILFPRYVIYIHVNLAFIVHFIKKYSLSTAFLQLKSCIPQESKRKQTKSQAVTCDKGACAHSYSDCSIRPIRTGGWDWDWGNADWVRDQIYLGSNTWLHCEHGGQAARVSTILADECFCLGGDGGRGGGGAVDDINIPFP